MLEGLKIFLLRFLRGPCPTVPGGRSGLSLAVPGLVGPRGEAGEAPTGGTYPPGADTARASGLKGLSAPDLSSEQVAKDPASVAGGPGFWRSACLSNLGHFRTLPSGPQFTHL